MRSCRMTSIASVLGFLPEELAVDRFGSSAAVADGRGDQVELRHVAAGPDAFDLGGARARRPRSSLLPSISDSKPPKSGFWLIAEMTAVAGISNSEPSMGTGRRRPEASGSPSSMRMHCMAVTRSPSLLETDRRGQEFDLDAFLHGLFDFLVDGRHLVDRSAVEDGHVRAQPLADPGRVDGRIAAADDDHHHVLAQVELLAVVEAVEEIDAGEDVGGLLALHAQRRLPAGHRGRRRRRRTTAAVRRG